MVDFRFYISNKKVWWNRGIEVKPTFNYFNSNFPFTEITNKEQFNISWVDEMHINAIVPLDKIDHMIKIEEVGSITKYYFRVQELNRTRENAECVFQLDIWCSYMMSGELGNIHTTKNLNIKQVSPFANIQPIGTPTGKIKKKRVPIEWRNTIFNASTEEYGKCFTLSKYNFNGVSNEDVRPEDNNIYFVFTDRNTDGSYVINRNKEATNYIIIPVMNCDSLGLFSALPGMYWGENLANKKSKHYGWIAPTWICNNYETLIRVVENKTEQHLGLGEFLGVWVGPSVLRFNKLNQNSKSQLILTSELPAPGAKTEIFDNRYLTLSHDFTKSSEIEKWGFPTEQTKIKEKYVEHINYLKRNVDNYRGTRYRKPVGDHNLIYEQWKKDNGVIVPSRIATLIAFRVSSSRIKLSPLNIDRTDFVKNLNYLGNPNNFLTTGETDLYFNQKFTFTNGKDSTDIDYQVPTSYDNYQNMLATQRNSMNTGLWVSGLNSLFSLSTLITGGVGGSISKAAALESDKWNNRANISRLVNIPRNIVDEIEANDHFKFFTSDFENAFTDYRFNQKNISKQQLGKSLSSLANSSAIGGNSFLQFISTLGRQEAYKKDLRTSISNTITNMTDNYITFFKMIENKLSTSKSQEVRNAEDINTYFNIVGTDLIYGYELMEVSFTKFYGYDDITTILQDEFYQYNDCYILAPEEYIITKELTLSNLQSPTIKKSIISLLENGIRIVNNPADLNIEED